MKIHAMSRDTGGCHFYRLRTPLMALRKLGHETSWGVQVTGEQLNELDVLIVQFLNGAEDISFLEFVSSLPRRPLLVYEVDDDLFSIHEVITNEVSRQPVIWGSPEVQARVKKAMGLCDLVTVTTPYLADLYRPYARRVAVLPNAIPDYMLDLPERTKPDKFTAGWVCSHSHLLDAREHYEDLQRFYSRNQEARFHWVGPPRVVAFAPWQQKVTPWMKDVSTYLRWLPESEMDVGIAPLGDFPFNNGKSGIKADEYSAIGIPTIASDFPQYRDVIVQGMTGFLVRGKTGWSSSLTWMMQNPDERERMGAAAKEMVAERTIGKTCYKWTDAYEEALS